VQRLTSNLLCNLGWTWAHGLSFSALRVLEL
jgi:hypothetical protein